MNDLGYMKRAYQLALKGRGKVSPNPMVGAVIVKDGRLIAQGYHQRYGEKHAETEALAKLKEGHAKGATLYVTLEPCGHWGKQPPCTQAIISSGIKRVVVGCMDPNPLMRGKSIKLLRRKGIKVDVGLLGNEIKRLNESFNKYITTGLPWVIAKTAQTIDGKIATAQGESQWITSDVARRFARSFRFGLDAIMVGVTTVLTDNPRLTSSPSKRLVKVILDSHLRVHSKAKLFAGTKPEDVLIFCTIKPTAKQVSLLAPQATIIQAPSKKGRVDLAWVLKFLGQQRIASVLIEGGSSLIGSALADRLVDQVMIYIAPSIMGEGLPSTQGLAVKKLSQIIRITETRLISLGRDILVIGDVKT